MPLKTTKSQTRIKSVNSDRPSESNSTQAKKDSSSDSEYNPFDQQIYDRRKEKGKVVMIINEQDISHYSKKSKRSTKRKVSFMSPSCNTSHSSGIAKKILLALKANLWRSWRIKKLMLPKRIPKSNLL